MLFLNFAVFGMMNGWSDWSWGNPYYARNQQIYSNNNNEAEYQRERGDNWKTYSQVAVPVLAGTTLLTGLGWLGRSLHKRTVPLQHEKKQETKNSNNGGRKKLQRRVRSQ